MRHVKLSTMISNTPKEWLEFLLACADESDDLMRYYFKKAHVNVETKANSTPVTEADLAIEKAIRKFASDKFTDLPVYAEEFGQCPEDSPLKFIVDPIDGTQNFIRGIPYIGTLLAIEVNGKIVAGVCSAGCTNERWWAHKDGGSFYNGKQNKVTTLSDLSLSQVYHGSLFGYEATGAPDTFLPLLAKTKRQRGVGDYLIPAMVAMGYGEFGVDFNLKPWDMAPLKLIVEEAGGVFTDLHGNDSIYTGTVVCSNGKFHNQLISELNS